MKPVRSLFLALACALGLHLVPFAGRAAADIPLGYLVKDLGTVPNGEDSEALDLNNLGQVVGASRFTLRGSTPVNHAFFWSANTGMVDVHASGYVPGGYWSVNDPSEVGYQRRGTGRGCHPL